jgi:hypothetical protein
LLRKLNYLIDINKKKHSIPIILLFANSFQGLYCVSNFIQSPSMTSVEIKIDIWGDAAIFPTFENLSYEKFSYLGGWVGGQYWGLNSGAISFLFLKSHFLLPCFQTFFTFPCLLFYDVTTDILSVF